jgi:hypothetical protein
VAGDGVEIAAGEVEQVVGHLEGWGGYEKSSTPSFARTEGAPVRRRVSWVVKGKGSVVIAARAARVGEASARVEIG